MKNRGVIFENKKIHRGLEGNQKAVAQRTSAPPDDATAVKLMALVV